MLLAVSGGSDSMVMAELFKVSGISFGVAHCNFGLRGIDADKDEELVRKWSEAVGVSFHAVRFDTKKKSAEWNTGTQETARKLRYDWFEEVCKQFGYDAVATAHHANDNVETLFINLCKGTGIQGLHGIQPVNGRVIRPLLFASRDQLRAYADEMQVPYRDDASNASDDYLRNAVRHKLVPVVEDLFPNAIANINSSISHFAEAEVLYHNAVGVERKKLMERRGQDYYIPIRKLQKRHPIATICYELFRPFGFVSAQIPHILTLLSSESGRFIASATHRVIRNREFLVVTSIATAEADLIEVQDAPAVVETERVVFSFELLDLPDRLQTDSTIAYIDADKVTFPLVLRKWRIGDYLYPLGMGMKKKKVSRLLIDRKVAIHDKEHVFVLESDKRIAWVAGIRLDERIKVTAATRRVLRVTAVPKLYRF